MIGRDLLLVPAIVPTDSVREGLPRVRLTSFLPGVAGRGGCSDAAADHPTDPTL